MFHDQRPGGDLEPVSADLAKVAAVSRLELTETEIGAGRREIEVEGELDLAVADRLQRAIAGCRSDQILISLKHCQFIDSTGIAVLVHARRDARARIVAHSPSDQVLRVLEATGLTADGLVFADREEALSALVQAVSS